MKNCLSLYILTYRQKNIDVQEEAGVLGILNYLKGKYDIITTKNYKRLGTIISVDYECPKIRVLEEIIKNDFGNLSNNILVYFVDDQFTNILTCLMDNRFSDNLLLYYYPFSEEDKTIKKNISKDVKKIIKYLLK